MFICNNCGNVFDEPSSYSESHPYGMGYASETICVCPYCRDTDFTEAEECSRCGEIVAETRDGLCDMCYEEMYE